MTTTEVTGAERADLLATLAAHRRFLRFTTRDLGDEQARSRTTVSQLTLGGIVKHVAYTEERWARFVQEGPSALGGSVAEHQASFVLGPEQSLAGVLADYEAIARRTDDLVRTLADLDASHPLPEAPWFPPGARWSARRVFLHILAETAQHAGHADIVREALDGAKTMG